MAGILDSYTQALGIPTVGNAFNDGPLGFGSPVSMDGAVLTSGYGPRDYTGVAGSSRVHPAIDIAGPTAAQTRDMSATAVQGGEVVSAGYRQGYGNTVEVRHPDGTMTRYSHLDSINVAPGQQVSFGQNLGMVGATGFKGMGAHLDFGVQDKYGKTVNPMDMGYTLDPMGRKMGTLEAPVSAMAPGPVENIRDYGVLSDPRSRSIGLRSAGTHIASNEPIPQAKPSLFDAPTAIAATENMAGVAPQVETAPAFAPTSTPAPEKSYRDKASNELTPEDIAQIERDIMAERWGAAPQAPATPQAPGAVQMGAPAAPSAAPAATSVFGQSVPAPSQPGFSQSLPSPSTPMAATGGLFSGAAPLGSPPSTGGFGASVPAPSNPDFSQSLPAPSTPMPATGGLFAGAAPMAEVAPPSTPPAIGPVDAKMGPGFSTQVSAAAYGAPEMGMFAQGGVLTNPTFDQAQMDIAQQSIPTVEAQPTGVLGPGISIGEAVVDPAAQSVEVGSQPTTVRQATPRTEQPVTAPVAAPATPAPATPAPAPTSVPTPPARPEAVPTVSAPTQSSIPTVPGLAPNIRDSFNQSGIAPPEGARMGYSPMGGSAAVYGNAPEAVQVAATGPGLFGALDRDFGHNIGTGIESNMTGRAGGFMGRVGGMAAGSMAGGLIGGPPGAALGGLLGGFIGSRGVNSLMDQQARSFANAQASEGLSQESRDIIGGLDPAEYGGLW